MKCDGHILCRGNYIKVKKIIFMLEIGLSGNPLENLLGVLLAMAMKIILLSPESGGCPNGQRREKPISVIQQGHRFCK